MAQLRKALALAIALALLPLALGGCAGALVVGGLAAAGGTGYMAGQERGVNGLASDVAVKTSIEANFLSADPRFQQGITTTVYEGRVLLTGRVPSQQMKFAADRIAGQTRGVRAVYDELVVAPPEQVWDDAKDAWITAELRSQMVLDPKVHSINYLVDTENGSVYLIGSARDQGELNRVTRIARYIPGVRRVVSYVDLRPGAPAAIAAVPAVPAGAAAVPPPEASGYPGAAPQAPIEVQKL
ncbi:MAG TPA: BON domain-containing protein [Stellaceae bacterium]|nr:BON domain-containing protein [Stellaceae bacterium]